MKTPHRSSELLLILAFLLILAAVPLTQTTLEVVRGERAQFTDVFRLRPTAANLRRYEKTLEDQSWFQQRLRPVTQHLLFRAFGDTGGKAVSGSSDWLFYRPDLRYLVEPDRLEVDASNSIWVQPPDGTTRRASVARAIVRFRDQLRQRGVQLLVMPTPGKPSVYPDQVTRRLADRVDEFDSPTQALLAQLRVEGVEVVDLFATFQEQRRRKDPSLEPLYLARDTHWTPQGAGLAARAVAARLRELGWAPEAAIEFKTQAVPVQRWGDILEMSQIPQLREYYPAETVSCVQVLDPNLGLLVPTPSDRPGCYQYPARQASVLILGDSFCRIYQYPEPRSLGEARGGLPANPDAGTKRLLPGSAGFISRLALALRAPVDAIVSDGGASTDVRKKLSTNPEILEGKRVVVWEFVERDIGLGRAGWEDVPLPPLLVGPKVQRPMPRLASTR